MPGCGVAAVTRAIMNIEQGKMNAEAKMGWEQGERSQRRANGPRRRLDKAADLGAVSRAFRHGVVF